MNLLKILFHKYVLIISSLFGTGLAFLCFFGIKILLGNSSLAKKIIKWKNKTSFKDLAIEMMKEDLRKVSLK